MGTSNLYGGPKKTSLLPSDYESDTGSEFGVPVGDNPDSSEPEMDDSAEGDSPQDNQDNCNSENQEENQPIQPGVSWGRVRGDIRRAMSDRSGGNVRRAVRNYTKALGGHTNATRQASKARKAAGVIYTYFAGTPDAIRKLLEESGIRFEGRPTKDIFNDICDLLAPIPIDLEDSLANVALRETFADVAADQSIDLNQLESFNEELLQRLVGGLIKHYIFDKLIMQSEQTALKNCERTSNLRDLEKSIKQYIDGIVDSVVPDIVKSGINPTDFNRAIETLFDVSYQQMEELR